jgi:hypothetical protein
MSFRKPQTIIRTTPGQYVDGKWVEGTEVNVPIMASVQPVTAEDQIVMPAGKRLSDYVKVYTSTELVPLSEGSQQQPDRLVWRGKQYECKELGVRQMDVLPHYKVIFSLVEQS